MKIILSITSLVLLSTLVQAELNLVEPKTDELKQSIPVEEIMPVKKELNELSILWGNLDIDKDGSISKMEAASSKGMIAQWDGMDSNKDEKIDTGEFAQFFTQQ